MTLANNPIEAGLDRFFKLGKSTDYLGRVALEKIAAEVSAVAWCGSPFDAPGQSAYRLCHL